MTTTATLRPGARVFHIKREQTGTYMSRTTEAGVAWVAFDGEPEWQKVTVSLLRRA